MTRTAFFEFQTAYFKAQVGHRKAPKRKPASSATAELLGISPSECDCFSYTTELSHLVYATALFDTFLTDLTGFLLLANPSSLGKDQTVPLEVLLATDATADVVTRLAKKRSRDLSYQGFPERLQFLRKQFGLSVALPKDVADSISHYSDARNAAVHDQGAVEVALQPDKSLSLFQTRCMRHPTPVKSKDIKKALNAQRLVAKLLCEEVIRRVLKEPLAGDWVTLLAVFDPDKAPSVEAPPDVAPDPNLQTQ